MLKRTDIVTLASSRFALSSRLAIRAPRFGIDATNYAAATRAVAVAIWWIATPASSQSTDPWIGTWTSPAAVKNTRSMVSMHRAGPSIRSG